MANGTGRFGLSVIGNRAVLTLCGSLVLSNPVGKANIHVAIGPQGYLLELVRTDAIMRPIDEATQADWDLVEKGLYVSAAGTLNTAMIVLERTRAAYLPVVKVGGETAPSQIVERLDEVDALRAYNKALSDAAKEEHS